MVKKIAIKYQQTWECSRLKRTEYAMPNAIESQYGFQCSCGNWTKIDINNHKILDTRPRVPDASELVDEKPMDKSKMKERIWKIITWDTDNKEHRKYIKAYTLSDAVDLIKKSGLREYSLFNDKFKNVANDGMVVIQ
jgi:hypothetical protein